MRLRPGDIARGMRARSITARLSAPPIQYKRNECLVAEHSHRSCLAYIHAVLCAQPRRAKLCTGSHAFLATIIKGCSSHTSSPSCTSIFFTIPAVLQRASTDALHVSISATIMSSWTFVRAGQCAAHKCISARTSTSARVVCSGHECF